MSECLNKVLKKFHKQSLEEFLQLKKTNVRSFCPLLYLLQLPQTAVDFTP